MPVIIGLTLTALVILGWKFVLGTFYIIFMIELLKKNQIT